MVDRLSAMQQSCIRCTCEGLTNTEIARRLGVSVNTVKGHLADAYDKLGVAGCSAPRTRAAVMLVSHDLGTHAGRLLRGGE